MTKQPGVSIAMATFNGARFLPEQLASLAAQQHLPSELVVCDDGSTDDTLALLERFALAAPFPVRLFRNPERLGYKANFLRAAGLCRHALVSLCDQDDVWRPDNLARVAACFDDDPDVLMVFHNARLVDAGLRPISPFHADPPVPARSGPLSLRPWVFSYGFTQTFRAVLLPAAAEWPGVEDHFHPGQPMGHDLFLFLVASGLGTIRYLDEMLADYRLHDNNTIGSRTRTRPGLLDRWRYRLENRVGSYRHFARVSALDAGLFDRLSRLDGLSSALQRRAAVAATAWSALPALYADRATVCDARLAARIAAFRRLRRAGAYGTGAIWTFGSRAMVKDLVLGVLLAPLVRRAGRIPFSPDDRACRRGKVVPVPASMPRPMPVGIAA